MGSIRMEMPVKARNANVRDECVQPVPIQCAHLRKTNGGQWFMHLLLGEIDRAGWAFRIRYDVDVLASPSNPSSSCHHCESRQSSCAKAARTCSY